MEAQIDCDIMDLIRQCCLEQTMAPH